MPGLMWLAGPRYAGRWPFCLTFVRGAGEDQVLAAFGADPGEPGIRATARSALTTAGPPGLPLVLVRPADGWLAALEQNVPPYGTRPDVLRAASAGGEAVAVYQDIGKLNHEFVHAADGQIVSAVRTTVPPHWWGDDPGRLQPLAEELGLGGAADSDLTSLEVLLALAEGGFGLSLEEADLDQPWRAAPIRPRPDDRPANPPGTAGAGAAQGAGAAPATPVAPIAPAAPATPGAPAGLADAGPAGAHVRQLLAAGLTLAEIAERAGMTPVGVDRLAGAVLAQIPAATAARLLAIDVP